MVTKVMFRTTVRDDSATSIQLGPSTVGFKPFSIDAVGTVKREIIDRALDRIAAITGPADEARDVLRDILKDAVLETSQLTPKVGDHVMTVVLDNPANTIRTALLVADPQRQAELFEQARQSAVGIDQQFRRDVYSFDSMCARSRRDLRAFDW